MQNVVAVLLICVAGVSAGCDKDPDGTNEKLFYTPCAPGEALIVNSLAVNKEDGSPDYPVDVRHPLDIVLNITNTASTAFDHITVSASIARYTDIFGFCSWVGVPTFGLLDNLNGCQFGNSTNICPLPPGVTVIRDHIDLSPFQLIINILSVSEPYRIQLSFKSAGREINCAKVEAKIVK